jgi:hypothetical protein
VVAYSAEISRRNPTCYLFLIDQSGSMADSFGANPSIQKAQFVSDALNRILQGMVIECSKGEGVRDYFSVGVIGYGDNVGPSLTGPLEGKPLVPISELANNPARVEERIRRESDGAGGIVEVGTKFPVWFDPLAYGGTPMCAAMSLAHTILQDWVMNHQDSFPPIVIHLTDGESTDGDPRAFATQLRGISTTDGNALLLNLHVSSDSSVPVLFPASEDTVPNDPYARVLYEMSDTLTPRMLEEAQGLGLDGVTTTSRGFVFNADIGDVVSFLEIGTRPANLR